MDCRLCLAVCALAILAGTASARPDPLQPLVTGGGDDPKGKVVVDIFVMSKCPDARRCESLLDDVLKQTHDIVHVRPNYIATFSGPGQIVCKHGPSECAGDVAELCAYEYSDSDYGNYGNFWKFLQCLNANFTGIGEADLTDACLSTSGYLGNDIAKIKQCYRGGKGHTLLRRSVTNVLEAHITTSCTIQIQHSYRCAIDGGQFLECPGGSEVADFVADICAAYQAIPERERKEHGVVPELPDACKASPETTSAEATAEQQEQQEAVVAY